MPPKRLVHAQDLRDAFPEEESCGVVERWATNLVSQVAKIAEQAGSQCASIQGTKYTCDNAEKVPEEVMSMLFNYQSACRRIYYDAEVIRTVISVRIPELKEEDNLGVAVQHAVLKMLEEIQNKTLGAGGAGGAGEKTSSVKAQAGVFSLREYFGARGAVEEKILGKPDDDKNNSKGGSKSPSVLLELRQVDVDALQKVELSALQLVTAMRSFVNAYALNWKKLIEPRSGGGRMVS
ncbi:putative proteasome activator protein pa26 [Trypanosoma cruzi]|nr:putative proteasome activator protein pa26 [Trypanosoma cruzi]KAF8302371.1 putative proteasome activator protein pa26 [Trypanosoma cruzi]PWV10292.1 putative proteasome activator protein pa26 [Trypanosoma cruzi]RNC61170.1 proteasome activator protein PA26 [Trypanosoma cruzi]